MQTLPSGDYAYVPGLPGYCASRNGRVFSCRRGGWSAIRPFLKGRVAYVTVYLGERGESAPARRRVADLVAWSFLGRQPPGSVVGYRDGDPANLAPGNLVYVEPDVARRLAAMRGAENSQSVLTEGVVIRIRREVHECHPREGDAVFDRLAKECGCTPQHIKLVASGRTWAHVQAGVPPHTFGPRPELKRNAKLDTADVRRIKQRLRNRETPRMIHRSYSHLVGIGAIALIAKGKTWKEVRA